MPLSQPTPPSNVVVVNEDLANGSPLEQEHSVPKNGPTLYSWALYSYFRANKWCFHYKEELLHLLRLERNRHVAALTIIDFRPLYPIEVIMKSYPKGYISPNIRKHNGKSGSAKEHVIQFFNDHGVNGFDFEFRLKAFSKSFTERAYLWYANFTPNSIKTWEDIISQFCAKFLVVEKKISISYLLGEQQV